MGAILLIAAIFAWFYLPWWAAVIVTLIALANLE